MAIKKALVFYSGKPPKSEKTNWIMHEYRLAEVDRSARKKNHSLRLDDWALCRIYHKKGAVGKQANPRNHRRLEAHPQLKHEALPQAGATDMICFDSSESLPRFCWASRAARDALSSPEFMCEREVEIQPRWDVDGCDDWVMDLGARLVDEDATVFRDSFQDLFVYLSKDHSSGFQ